MELEEEIQNLTAFITPLPLGLYNWKRIFMGLASSPRVLQIQIELVIAGLSYKMAPMYLDDVIVFGLNFDKDLKR